MLHDLDAAIASIGDLRDRPSGTIRVTATEHAAKMVLLPAMRRLLPDHPDIKVEINMDYAMTDVVADRFDAGVRLGGDIAKDMIAVRIGPDIAMAIVRTPDYFRRHPPPRSPAQLVDHRDPKAARYRNLSKRRFVTKNGKYTNRSKETKFLSGSRNSAGGGEQGGGAADDRGPVAAVPLAQDAQRGIPGAVLAAGEPAPAAVVTIQ